MFSAMLGSTADTFKASVYGALSGPHTFVHEGGLGHRAIRNLAPVASPPQVMSSCQVDLGGLCTGTRPVGGADAWSLLRCLTAPQVHAWKDTLLSPSPLHP